MKAQRFQTKKDFTTEFTESTEKKARSGQPEMAVQREKKNDDFAGIGVYGRERAARARVAVL